VISGISVSPKRNRLGLYYLLFFENIGQEEVCAFLQALLRHLRGPLLVLLDNSSTHNEKAEPFQKLLTRHPRLHIEHFPAYAPELNPEEGVWALAKGELANSCPKNVEELMEEVIRSINGIRMSPRKLRGCILQSDLPSFLR
jgi:transposase